MKSVVVIKSYAKALEQIVTTHGDHDTWQQLLDNLTVIINDTNTQKFVNNPHATMTNKVAFFYAVLKNTLNRSLSNMEKNFINLLISNNRILMVNRINALFNDLINTGVKKIKIISAYPLNNDEKSNIIKQLKNKYRCDIGLDLVIDNNLGAGLICKENDKVIDLSLTARVNSLADQLSIQ